MAQTFKNKYTEIKLMIDSDKEIKTAIKSLVADERARVMSCERRRTDELDKAVCQIQKDMKSLRVIINRLDSQSS